MGYPSDWSRRRERVFRRDDYTCQECGAMGGDYGPAQLHAHHIVPTSRGGTHDLGNLETRCSNCHRTEHQNPRIGW